MTSKNLFFNLMKEDAKRRLWTLAISFLVFFFSLPVKNALVIGNYKKNIERFDYQEMVSDIIRWLSFQNEWIAVLLIIISIIMGVTSFSYLHSKQKVDFYHGIPVNRSVLFWAHYFNGILIPVAAYGAALLINMGVVAVNGINPATLLGMTISSFLLFLLHYIMLYSVSVLAMVLTGNILIGILGTGVLHFYFPCLLGVFELYCKEFLHTRYSDSSYVKTIFYKLVDKSSALALFIINMDQFKNENQLETKVLRILFVLGVTVVLAFLTFWLYKKRGSEAAGKAMAFKISMPVIRIPIVILSSLFGSIFFWFIHDSLGWAFFGLLCGMILSHCVIEIIYHFDFRKLFSHWKQMMICAFIAIVIFCGFRYDLLGYDNYIPEENSIESVAVSTPYMTDWVTYGDIEQNPWGTYNWNNMPTDDYVFNHMALKNVSPVLSLVQDAIKRNQKLYHQGLFMRENEASERLDERKWYVHFNVRYNMKNGKSKYRSYTLSYDEIRPELMELYENPDYLNGVYPVLTQTPENTVLVRVRHGEQIEVASSDRNGTDKAMTEKLLLAYQEDLKSLKAETMQKENPIANIQFITRKQLALKNEETDEDWKYNDFIYNYGFYPIYPTFERTLELLKEHRIDVDSWSNKKAVKVILIDVDKLMDYNYYGYSSRELKVSDEEQIAQIMRKAVITEYSHMNPFSMKEEEKKSVHLSVRDSNNDQMEYMILIDQLPASIKDAIEKMINQE